MPRGKRQITATGFYTAIALIVYALIGAITNDLYIPGRRSGRTKGTEQRRRR